MKTDHSIIYAFCLISFCLFSIFSISKLDYKNIPNVLKCSELTYEESLKLHPKNFKSFNLKISFLSERKWRRRILEDKIQSYKNMQNSGYHTEFFTLKNRNKAILYFELPNQLECKLIANVRPHGDFNDHRPMNKIQSLNVNLLDGHIFGITKFILLRPETRNGNSEILLTSILNQIGILAPRSSYINFSHKEKKEKFIFQEKISKEFLEYNFLRESALYQGDERFIWWDPYETINISRHKLSNTNWAIKNKSSLFISEKGLSILNQTNQLYRSSIPQIHVVDYFSLGKKINNNYFDELDLFDALIYSLEAEHALSRDDRRFYFSTFYQKFLPIYYDGMSEILRSDKVNNSAFLNQEDIVPNKSDLKQGKVTLSAVSGSQKAINIINELNFQDLQSLLKLRGLNISKETLQKIKKNIILNLETIKNFSNQRLFSVNYDFNKRSFINEKDKINKKISRRFVYYDDSYENFLNCDLFGKSCTTLKIDNEKKSLLISQELKDTNENHLIYIGKKLGQTVKDGWFIDYATKKFKKEISRKKVNYYDHLTFQIIGEINFDIDQQNKIANFSRTNLFGKVIFTDNVENWTINFNDNSEIDHNQIQLDKNGLTGCLNFIDTVVVNLKIDISNSNCEDAVNFIRTKGNIDHMNIKNSLSDSMDADFSNLNFKNFYINKSGNDCLDFSWGNYTIEKGSIKNCGDKAVSVGESSSLTIRDSFISNSNVGIASKDYSKTISINNVIQDTQYCFKAYNKKQEFSGAEIISKKSKCENSYNTFYKDKTSSLKINL